ncbi:L,D-transpeptidase family protein [Longispora sp. NPDC051575]|uniref:L,D-transpeptidase n=1 Tax=Longispora sp. NPDC051575 TaxID=3154943 RepID=UPI00342D31B5
MRSGIGMAAIGIALLVPTAALYMATAPDPATRPVVVHAVEATPPVVAEQAPAPVAVPEVSAERLASLVEATTWTTVSAAPVDTDRQASGTGLVVHNDQAVPVFDAPGGTPIARLPQRQGASATWLPVIGGQTGWFLVLLPARPNGASGWISASGVQVAHSPFEIHTSLSSMRLDLLRDGAVIGSWATSPGKADTPSPVGRTFILAAIKDSAQPYSPIILPLGAHSEVLSTFGGGPGVVALHSWPSDSVMGTAASHGCIRIPQAAIAQLLQVPAGTLVKIIP